MPGPIQLDAALRYAALGIPVVPICQGGRIPHADHGVHDATIDVERIRCWWRRWPRADVALACGAAAGFDALDVDRQHGGWQTLRELIDVHGPIPDGPKQQTPSGGVHLLFAHRPGLKNRCGGQGGAPLGLDCRTTGGMIKTAPSNGYRWIRYPALDLLPPWPEWLADFYREQVMTPTAGDELASSRTVAPEHADQAVRYVIGALEGLAHDLATANPGSQQTTLNNASFRAGRLIAAVPDFPLETAIEQLITAGMAMENEPGRPPWTRRDVERAVRRAVDDGIRHGPAVLPDFATGTSAER